MNIVIIRGTERKSRVLKKVREKRPNYTVISYFDYFTDDQVVEMSISTIYSHMFHTAANLGYVNCIMHGPFIEFSSLQTLLAASLSDQDIVIEKLITLNNIPESNQTFSETAISRRYGPPITLPAS